MTQEKRLFLTVYITLFFLFALRLVPFLFPNARFWGFNHLIFLPIQFTILFIIFAAIALCLPWLPPLSNFGEKLTGLFNKIFFESSRRVLYRLSAIAIFGVLFALLPTKTFFLGDGYSSLDNLASQSGTYFKWSERGTTYILDAVQSLYGDKNIASSLAAFRTVSVLSGIVAIWFFFLISEMLSDDKLKRMITFVVSLFSGILLLFFGYVESYPMLWIAYPAFIYFSLRYLKYQKGLLWVGLSLLFSLAIHFLTAVFIPAFIYLTFCQGKGLKLYHRWRTIFWAMIFLFLALFTFLFFRKLSGNLYFQNIFLPPFEGKPLDSGYFLFSLSHLIDILNIFLLLSPGILILLVLASGNFKKIFTRKDSIYLMLCSAGTFGFLFIIDPTLGLGRDWDLFSLSAYAPTLLFIFHIGNSGLKSLKKLNISFILLLILSCTPYLLTNLNENHAQKYIIYLADLDPKKTFGSFLSLQRYNLDQGDSTAITALKNNRRAVFDLEDNYKQATRFLDIGQVERALPFVNAIPPDKYSARYHNLLSSTYFHNKEISKALEESNIVISLNNYNAIFFYNRANIFWALRQPDSSLVYLQHGYKLDNRNLRILEGLAGTFLFRNQPDSSIFYGEKLITFDATGSIGHYFLTKAYALTGQITLARQKFDEYIRLGKNDPNYNSRRQELRQFLISKE
jgi:tetratricopeptide (TPR) repeat protein